MKIIHLILMMAVTELLSCEKEPVEPLKKEFKVINYDAFINYGDTTSYHYLTAQETPALYLQGYAEDSLFCMRVDDYYISPIGREGDWVYHQTRYFTTVLGQITVLPYENIRIGQHVAALYYMEEDQRRFLLNLYFEIYK